MLNIPAVIEGESLSSYLHRLSACNHYPTPYCLLDLLKINEIGLTSNDFNETSISDISNWTGISSNILSLMAGKQLENNIGISSYEKFMMKRRTQYCPECIKLIHFQKLLWSFLPLNSCVEHGIKLIEKCPGCGAVITVKNLVGGKCSYCGFIYKFAMSMFIEPSSIFYLSQLEIIKRLNDVSTGLFPDVSTDIYFQLAHHSQNLLDGLTSRVGHEKERIRYFHNKSKGQQTSENIAHSWANFYWMYLEFPKNYCEILNDFHENKKKGMLKYPLLSRFEDFLQGHELSNIENAYHEFWLQKLDEGSVRRDFAVFKKNPELLNMRRFVRKDEVRNTIGLSYDYVQQLNNQHHIKLITKDIGNSKGYFIERETLEMILTKKENLISRKEAALILGIRRDSIQRLVEAGLLQLHKLTTAGNGLLDRIEVENLVGRCRGTFVNKPEDEYISFHDALIKYSVCQLSIVKIIEYTQSGQLKPVSLSLTGSLADNFYSINDLSRCIDQIKEEYNQSHGYFMKDVMRVLRIGEKKMKTLMVAGKIAPQRVINLSDGRKRYLFNKKEIDLLSGKEIS